MVQRVIIGRLSGIFGRISVTQRELPVPSVVPRQAADIQRQGRMGPRLRAKEVFFDGQVTFSRFSG
jgi:hypothetical protein